MKKSLTLLLFLVIITFSSCLDDALDGKASATLKYKGTVIGETGKVEPNTSIKGISDFASQKEIEAKTEEIKKTENGSTFDLEYACNSADWSFSPTALTNKKIQDGDVYYTIFGWKVKIIAEYQEGNEEFSFIIPDGETIEGATKYLGADFDALDTIAFFLISSREFDRGVLYDADVKTPLLKDDKTTPFNMSTPITQDLVLYLKLVKSK